MSATLLAEHLKADDPLAPYADRLTSDALGGQSLRGYLSGSIDVVLRFAVGGRFVVVDYKTNKLGDADRPLTAADYGRVAAGRGDAAFGLSAAGAALSALCCTVFCAGGSRATTRATHLGGVMYLFVRGMCGPDTPVIDGHPAGVFSWTPPATLVIALSDMLDAGRAAA